MSTSPILELVPGDVVYVPISGDGTTQGPITVEWVQEERDGTLCVGWHAGGEDHVLCLPLDLAVFGAQLVGWTITAALPLATSCRNCAGCRHHGWTPPGRASTSSGWSRWGSARMRSPSPPASAPGRLPNSFPVCIGVNRHTLAVDHPSSVSKTRGTPCRVSRRKHAG